ncbi:MAG: hypothetical protein HKN43_07770 [Rhodothermales bacterium]|nr:hypothetical protein [Rhodothermales bacterium]
MNSIHSRPATLGALVLCVLLSGILASRCIDNLNTSGSLSAESLSAVQMLPVSDAAVLGKIDVRELQQDALGLAGDFSLEDIMDDVNTEFGARLRSFSEQTGFDPMTDIRSVYYTASGKGHDTEAAMVVHANMDADEMNRFIRENLGDEVVEATYNGVTIFKADDGDGISFAFVNDNVIAVAPSERAVQIMIDRSSSSASSGNADMTRLINLVSGNDAWMVIPSIQSHASMDDMDNVDNRFVMASRAIDQLAVGVDVSSGAVNFQTHIGPTENVTASDLESIVKGAIAAARTMAMEEQPIIAEMLDQVVVSRRSGMVRVSMTVDNEDLEQLRIMAEESHQHYD